MGDVGDDMRALREHNKNKRHLNLERSTKILDESEFFYKKLSDAHFRVENKYDFWPSTGLFIELKTRFRGRGVFNLLKKLRSENGPERQCVPK